MEKHIHKWFVCELAGNKERIGLSEDEKWEVVVMTDIEIVTTQGAETAAVGMTDMMWVFQF